MTFNEATAKVGTIVWADYDLPSRYVLRANNGPCRAHPGGRHWCNIDGSTYSTNFRSAGSVHPLLVLDPENRIDARKFVEALDKVMHQGSNLVEAERINNFQGAIREMAAPLKREVYEHIVTSAIGKPTVMQSICGKVWTPDPERTVSVGKCPECRDAITRWES